MVKSTEKKLKKRKSEVAAEGTETADPVTSDGAAEQPMDGQPEKKACAQPHSHSPGRRKAEKAHSEAREESSNQQATEEGGEGGGEGAEEGQQRVSAIPVILLLY